MFAHALELPAEVDHPLDGRLAPAAQLPLGLSRLHLCREISTQDEGDGTFTGLTCTLTVTVVKKIVKKKDNLCLREETRGRKPPAARQGFIPELLLPNKLFTHPCLRHSRRARRCV